MNYTPLIINLHILATVFMTGLIWMVQVVHYPLMARVGRDGFVTYQVAHMKRITCLVGIAMPVEMITALWIWRAAPAHIPSAAMHAGLILLGIIWLSTILLQVPCHHKLEKGFDPSVHRQLVRTNWIRTLAWTARGALAVFIF